MKILAVIGVPGVGKTTLMWGIIEALGGIAQRPRIGLCDFCGLDKYPIAILGKYEWGSIFSGTDQLSTAVQPDAERALRNFVSPMSELKQVFLGVPGAKPIKPLTSVAFEGDRLANTSFLQFCASVGNLRVVVVRCKPDTLKRRRADRSMLTGRPQDATWLKGRETKVNSLAAAFSAETLELDNSQQLLEAVIDLSGWLRGAP